ncbi:hypothetical protein KDA_20920 [Dictyobacter alpinus]|uniref:Uncharacterized protein n=1 Tax=Dictyobacter alpinus TaxID=2014873 RepID=A0A402B5H6_9CHLR|nr:hypothetical protein KDA_20920 [Dictyobacter alpinus]
MFTITPDVCAMLGPCVIAVPMPLAIPIITSERMPISKSTEIRAVERGYFICNRPSVLFMDRVNYGDVPIFY